MSSPSTPQRVTRSMSSNPNINPVTSATTPGPPVPNQVTSLFNHQETPFPCNPFEVDLVIPFDISIGKDDRTTAQQKIREGYEELLRALEGVGGLKIASRPGRAGKGKEEVWVFVGGDDEKISQLVEQEK